MTFQNRVKEEMKRKDWIVKELAKNAKLSKRTIDSYLDTRNVMPPADNAVRIAEALGVTVEYLVTGETKSIRTYSPEIRTIIEKLEFLDSQDRQTVESLIDNLSLRYTYAAAETHRIYNTSRSTEIIDPDEPIPAGMKKPKTDIEKEQSKKIK